MAKTPLLTISLLCSGREETKKCLDSLKTLREKVPSELILVDTGCDEEKRKLLHHYTDQVIPFSWCDDFSKARNAGLERACGEWFMFLDDDEWFPDTKEIEEFFLSGEYKRYGFASYTVRNYLDEDGYTYEDSYPVRLVCLQSGVKFKGIIHEILTPLSGREKQLSAMAEHYGYVYRSPEEKRKHSERNRTLLLRALKEDVEDVRMWTHLVQQYRAEKDYKELKEFCMRALRKFEDKSGNEINRDRGCFYCGLVEADIELEDYEAAETDFEKALTDKRNTDYCVAKLLTLGAEIFTYKGKEKQARECCRRYFRLLEYYKTRQEELMAQDVFSVREAFHQITQNNMYSYQICLDLENRDTASLKKYFDDFVWDGGKVYMTEQFMPCIVKAMAQLPYEDIFVHVAEVLANKPGMDNFWEEVEKIDDEDGIRRLVRIFSEVTDGITGEAAVKLRKMLQAEKEDDWDGFSAALKDAVGICPLLGGILKRYAEIYAKQRMERVEKEEMQVLAAQIKEQVQILLSQGMKQQALQILEQLKNLIPEDEELIELERNIHRGI